MADRAPIIASLRREVEACEHRREQLIGGWRDNVSAQRGKAAASEDDTRRSRVTSSWSLTKTKGAQLYSAQPEVRVTPRHGRQDAAPIAAVLAQRINDCLTENRLTAIMDEVVADVVSAAGIGAVIVAYESRQIQKEMPVSLFNQQETISVPYVNDARYLTERISPQDFLWPIGFKGSDFDRAPWIGRTVRLPWARAKVEWGLSEEIKSKVITSGQDRSADRHLVDDTGLERDPLEVVEARELFYHDATYDPEAPTFKSIRRLVLVKGVDENTEPAVDEPWKGQQITPNGYLGACRYPIRVLTLSRVPDEPIPPSDVSVTRPMEQALEESATNERRQQQASIPLRGYDVNKLDPLVADALEKGEWQPLIPTIGDPATALKAIASAHYPPERTHFDARAEREIRDAWAMGPNQTGNFASGERSAEEAQNVAAAAGTRIAYERGKVAAFITGIAEVLAGLIQLYDDGRDLPEEAKARLLAVRQVPLEVSVLFEVRPDTLVVEEAAARLQKLMAVYSNLAPSGYVNVEPLVREIVELSGLDPAVIVRPPQPKSPEPVNISVRSAEDLLSPLFLALLMKSGQAPAPQELQAAMRMIRQALADTASLPALHMALKGTEPEMPAVVGADAGMAMGANGSPQPSSPRGPDGPNPPPVDAEPRLENAPRVNKRRAPGESGEGL